MGFSRIIDGGSARSRSVQGYKIAFLTKQFIDGHLTEEQALDEMRDLCAQLQKLRDRMPCRGSSVAVLSTLLEQCSVTTKAQMIAIEAVKRVDSHANGSKEMFKPKQTEHSTDGIPNVSTISNTCPKNDIGVNGARNVCEQMRSHLSQVNENATCPTHICTTADVCAARGVANETPVYSSDCHNERRQLSPQAKHEQSFENVSVENANRNEQQSALKPPPPPLPSSSSSSSKNTKQELDFSNLKLRCMCSEVDKSHSCAMGDETAVAEINASENATTAIAPCLRYRSCEHSDCGKECYLIRRCCFCRQSNYNSDADGAGQGTASANNKSSNVHSHDEATVAAAVVASVGDSVQIISPHRHSCSCENSNLKLTLSTRKSDKACRCESEHCHNNQSYCDDGAIKNSCHCMRMCDFDLDRKDNERETLSVHSAVTVTFAPEVGGLASGANASTAAAAVPPPPPDRIRKKCDKSLVDPTKHPFSDREAGHPTDLSAEPTASTTIDTGTDTHPTTSDCSSTTIAEDTSNVINNLTNEKRNKTNEKLVLDLNDRSKYTKEVSV